MQRRMLVMSSVMWDVMRVGVARRADRGGPAPAPQPPSSRQTAKGQAQASRAPGERMVGVRGGGGGAARLIPLLARHAKTPPQMVNVSCANLTPEGGPDG